MIGIYKYTNKRNGKIYIGRSINIANRKWQHLHNSSPYSYFDNVLNSIGENCFDFEIVEECNIEELKAKEIFWIKYYKCCVLDEENNGYNLTRGGEEYKSENNPWAKLTEENVKEIIKKLENEKVSIQDIAKEYNVHYNTISNINRCKSWNWLHNYKNNIRIEIQGSVNRGEFGTNKITEEQAKKIIYLLEKDKRSLVQISKDENIGLYILYDINRCKTWNWLHNYKKNIRNEYKKGGDANYEDKR